METPKPTLRMSENSNIIAVLMREHARVTEEGIVLSKKDSIILGERQKMCTVYAAPERYTFERVQGNGKVKEIITACPVKAGDTLMVDQYAGIKTEEIDGLRITFIRIEDIHAVVEPTEENTNVPI